jgi:subtilase family serine protease
VAYFASTGDLPGVQYPSASPNVFGVGGTTFSRNQTTGAFQSEAVWNSAYSNHGTGGGYSAYESRPSYQNAIAGIVGGQRGVTDLAALADPLTGFWVYNTGYLGGWAPIGGTSLASPLVAGIVNRAGFFWSSSFAGLTNIYNLANAGTLKNYVTDITSGLCGAGGSAGGTGQGDDPQFIEAATGIAWDPCTGWGTPHGNH